MNMRLRNTKGFILSIALFMAVFALGGCSEDPAQKHFEKAESLLSRGEYIEALSRYNHVVNTFQGSPYAASSQYKIAFILNRHLGDRNAAVNAYYLLYNVYPKSPEAVKAHEDLAGIYSAGGQHTKALGEYELLIKQNPSVKDRYRRLIALEYLKVNDLRQARVELNELVSGSRDRETAAEALVNLAETYYIEGDADKALELYDRAIAKYPGEKAALNARFGKARTLEETGKLGDALAILKDLLDEYPNREAVNLRIQAIEQRLRDTSK